MFLGYPGRSCLLSLRRDFSFHALLMPFSQPLEPFASPIFLLSCSFLISPAYSLANFAFFAGFLALFCSRPLVFPLSLFSATWLLTWWLFTFRLVFPLCYFSLTACLHRERVRLLWLCLYTLCQKK